MTYTTKLMRDLAEVIELILKMESDFEAVKLELTRAENHAEDLQIQLDRAQS
jgi:phage-related tail protein